MPIEPVSPTTITSRPQCFEDRGAELGTDPNRGAEPRLKAGAALVQQHTEAVNHRVAAASGGRQQTGL
jgi:hypothetical protein